MSQQETILLYFEKSKIKFRYDKYNETLQSHDELHREVTWKNNKQIIDSKYKLCYM